MNRQQKLMQRNGGAQLGRGMSITMDDGWRGKVHQIARDTVICIHDGERPNDWLRGYRAFNQKLAVIKSGKAVVAWKSRATAATTVNREQRDAVVVDLARVKLERSWDSAPL